MERPRRARPLQHPLATRQPYSQPFQVASAQFIPPHRPPNCRLPVTYRPAHRVYIPAASPPSASSSPPPPQMQNGGQHVHHHHYHHTYHHQTPPFPASQPPPSEPFRRSHPFLYHPAAHPAFRHAHRPGYAHAQVHPTFVNGTFMPPIPGLAVFPGGPFPFPPAPYGHQHGWPGSSSNVHGNENEGDVDVEEDQERERAFPPSGPRVFNEDRGNPLQAHPGGNHGRSFPSPRRRGRGRGRNGGNHTGREGCAWEVHHPDGTVEYGEDEPKIEEVPLEDDENEGSVQQERERHQPNEEALKSDRPTQYSEEEGIRLQIEWEGAGQASPSNPSIQDVSTGVTTSGPPQADRTTRERPDVIGQIETTDARTSDGPPLRRVISDDQENFELSPGTLAPNGTPELRSLTDMVHLPEKDQLELRGGMKDEKGVNLESAYDVDMIRPSTTLPKGSRKPLPIRLEAARHDQFEDPPGLVCGTHEQKTGDGSSISKRRTLNEHRSSPIMAGDAEISEGLPLSATLPSPEPAQVLDRLLEVTGLSARQFMTMLERGEFKMEDSEQGRAS